MFSFLGVALSESSDGLGQQYVTPETAVSQKHTDIIIVGRAILKVRPPLRMKNNYLLVDELVPAIYSAVS